MQEFGTHGLATIMQILILTGSFACAMAFHNIAMRYFYAMGREGVLPARARQDPQRAPLAVHRERHADGRSPSLIVAAWGIDEGFDNPTAAAYVGVYGMMAVQGVVYILAIQALCALAIIVYFRKHKELHSNPLVVIVCPIIAIVGAGVRDLPALRQHPRDRGHDQLRRSDLVDRRSSASSIAAAYAFYIKATDREKYDLIGRVIDEGIVP